MKRLEVLKAAPLGVLAACSGGASGLLTPSNGSPFFSPDAQAFPFGGGTGGYNGPWPPPPPWILNNPDGTGLSLQPSRKFPKVDWWYKGKGMQWYDEWIGGMYYGKGFCRFDVWGGPADWRIKTTVAFNKERKDGEIIIFNDDWAWVVNEPHAPGGTLCKRAGTLKDWLSVWVDPHPPHKIHFKRYWPKLSYTEGPFPAEKYWGIYLPGGSGWQHHGKGGGGGHRRHGDELIDPDSAGDSCWGALTNGVVGCMGFITGVATIETGFGLVAAAAGFITMMDASRQAGKCTWKK